MTFERGMWRYIGTGGMENPQRDDEKKLNEGNIPHNANPQSDDKKKLNGTKTKKGICPICGKKQPNYRNNCVSCNYNFKNRNNDFENAISKLKGKFKFTLVKLQKLVKHMEYNTPIFLDSNDLIFDRFDHLFKSNSENNKILFISDEDIIEKLQLELVKNKCSAIKLANDSITAKSLFQSINNFKSINKSLSVYSIKKFNNIFEAKDIVYLKYLKNNARLIDEKDIEKLNNFIKVYWKYCQSSQIDDDFKQNISDLKNNVTKLISELLKLKKSILWLCNNLNKLTKFYDSFGVKYRDIEEQIDLMDEIDILKKSPNLIDKNEGTIFINNLKKYQESNEYGFVIHDNIEGILNNDVVSRLLKNFKHFCDDNDEYKKINVEISNLKNLLKSAGINCNNLDEYYSIKDKFYNVENLIYFEQDDYVTLNEKINQYLNYHNESFSSTLNKNKQLLTEHITKLSDENKINLKNTQKFIKTISKIQDALQNIGIKINSISELESNKSIKWLLDNELSFSDYTKTIGALDKFYINVDSDKSIHEHYVEILDKLSDVIDDIFSSLKVDFYNDFEKEYIEYNLNNVKQLIEKMGISVRYLNDLEEIISKLPELSEESLKSLKNSNIEEKLDDINLNGVYTDNTLSYLQNTAEMDILNDLNLLNISIQSLKYEISHNENFKYYNNLNADCSTPSDSQTDLNEFKLKIKKWFASDNIEHIMNNYQNIFEYCFELVEKKNLLDFKDKLNNLHDDFDNLHEVYDTINCSNNLEIIDNTPEYLITLKENDEKYSDIKKLYTEGFFNEETLKLIENNEIKDKLSEVYELYYSINDILLQNNYSSVTLDELLLENESIIKNCQINENNYHKLLSSVKSMDLSNFERIYLELNNELPDYESQIDDVLGDFGLMVDIKNLFFEIKIPNYEDIIYLDYSTLKSLNNFLNYSKDYSNYIDSGIININLFSNFNMEIKDIDIKINEIKKELTNLNLDYQILNNFSMIKSERLDDISSKLEEIYKINEFDPDDLSKTIKIQRKVVDLLNELCISFPNESEYLDDEFNSTKLKIELFKFKKELENYDDLLDLELKILQNEKIINQNLLNEWKGPFTDIDLIKNKISVDIEFTEKYDKGIFTDKTIEKLNTINDFDMSFISNFNNQLATIDKAKSILLYENQKEILEELNKLENMRQDDLIEIKNIFIRLNNLIYSEKIDKMISILKYYAEKNNEFNNVYLEELKSYSAIYNKYFDSDVFNLSFEEVLTKIKINLKLTELINDGILKEYYLEKIKSNIDDFNLDIVKLDLLSQEIMYKLYKCCELYGNQHLNPKSNFKHIKKEFDKSLKSNIYLANIDTIRKEYNNNYKDYFDYVICDIDEISIEDEIRLVFISRKKLNLIQIGE